MSTNIYISTPMHDIDTQICLALIQLLLFHAPHLALGVIVSAGTLCLFPSHL